MTTPVTTTRMPVTGLGSVTVTAALPLTAYQAGGNSGAIQFKDANGNYAKVCVNGETAGSVFAEASDSQVYVNAILAVFNSTSPAPTVITAPVSGSEVNYAF